MHAIQDHVRRFNECKMADEQSNSTGTLRCRSRADQYCLHCKEYVSHATFYRHKHLSPVQKKRRGTGGESDSDDSDFEVNTCR